MSTEWMPREQWDKIDYIGNSVILTEGVLKPSLCYLFHHREIKAKIV